jgi:hypothetical protein
MSTLVSPIILLFLRNNNSVQFWKHTVPDLSSLIIPG